MTPWQKIYSGNDGELFRMEVGNGTGWIYRYEPANGGTPSIAYAPIPTPN